MKTTIFISGYLRDRYMATAARARESGQSIEINTRLPYVAIERGEDDSFFFQEHEASDLLDTVPANISAEDYLLAQAQEW